MIPVHYMLVTRAEGAEFGQVDGCLSLDEALEIIELVKHNQEHAEEGADAGAT